MQYTCTRGTCLNILDKFRAAKKPYSYPRPVGNRLASSYSARVRIRFTETRLGCVHTVRVFNYLHYIPAAAVRAHDPLYIRYSVLIKPSVSTIIRSVCFSRETTPDRSCERTRAIERPALVHSSANYRSSSSSSYLCTYP